MAAKGDPLRALKGLSGMRRRRLVILLLLGLCLQPVQGYLSSEQHITNYAQDVPQAHVTATPAAAAVKGEAAGPIQEKVQMTGTTSYSSKCPSRGLCSKLPPVCLSCNTSTSCRYGKPATFQCSVKPAVDCVDESGQPQKTFPFLMKCQFCWQLPPSQYRCSESTSCMTVSCPRKRYNATCSVLDHVHCLGNREFHKMLYCNWTGGYKWSTALALSITLGGFGADRFYLGQWREGLGKLFSFGGLGIWTLIDVLLIGVGYVGPADGSLYI
ncbi:TM2 domain-containing protein 3 isoform X1 [Polyodon spathula]|uniref:TM2 domain-containing protein 3 isoform X1 n=1 Tax=Polyodon spathula TaxID=7913 RepID=UPI001B7F7807|nr:TM2 domain-containing protein 3 isoform X1 [Polyodon spathula]